MYSIQHYVIEFVSNLRQVGGFSGHSGFLHQWNWPPRYVWNIVESGVKHHNHAIMWNNVLIYVCRFILFVNTIYLHKYSICAFSFGYNVKYENWWKFPWFKPTELLVPGVWIGGSSPCFFVGRGVHVILRKVSPCTIEDNVFGEYHSLCTLKTSYFVYFQNRSVGAFLSLQQTNISAPTQLSILFQWQSKVDLVDLSLLYRFYILLNLFSSW